MAIKPTVLRRRMSRFRRTIEKFVGDAVVAFWGAPIARSDDADRAVDALVDIVRFHADFSARSGSSATIRTPMLTA